MATKTKPNYRSALDFARERERGESGVFEYGGLSDDEKRRLCLSLLAEFGAMNIKERGDGELEVCCVMPWHNEKGASAGLNFKKLTYNCFSCGSSGGLLWFIGMCRGTTGAEAREWLGEETGIGNEVQDIEALLRFLDSLYAPAEGRTPIPRMSPDVLEPWKVIHPYLTEDRRIPEDAIKHFQVGYAPQYKYGEDKSGNPLFSERIVIPHFWQGDLVGWQTRRLWKDGTSKYLNTPDFPRDETLFNHDSYRSHAIVVESPMSVLRHWTLTPDITATFGAAVTPRQVQWLARHRRVTIFFDNDDAGWDAAPLLADGLSGYCDVRIVMNPYDADPADLDPATYLGLVSEAVPYSVWEEPRNLLPWKEAS